MPKPRNTAKQIVTIKGQPDCLYKDDERTLYSLEFEGNKHGLGDAGSDLISTLKKMNSNAVISSQIKINNVPSKISDISGLHIRKYYGDTLIEVLGISEEEVFNKIDKIKEYLSKYNVYIQERCLWTCKIDKGKSDVGAENIETPKERTENIEKPKERTENIENPKERTENIEKPKSGKFKILKEIK